MFSYGPFELRGREGSRVELVRNRLIFGQLYSTPLLPPSIQTGPQSQLLVQKFNSIRTREEILVRFWLITLRHGCQSTFAGHDMALVTAYWWLNKCCCPYYNSPVRCCICSKIFVNLGLQQRNIALFVYLLLGTCVCWWLTWASVMNCMYFRTCT